MRNLHHGGLDHGDRVGWFLANAVKPIVACKLTVLVKEILAASNLAANCVLVGFAAKVRAGLVVYSLTQWLEVEVVF